MSDAFIFIFGLIATLAAVGPLIVAGIIDQRSKKE
jgi:hypothetical protein